MNKLLLITIALIVIFLTSCKPSVYLVVKDSSNKYVKTSNETDIFEIKDSLPNNSIYLGRITVHHAWKNKKCDYKSVLKIVVDEAHDLGSDLVTIIEQIKDLKPVIRL